ncbi:sugar ABC transporter substrate-binding protein [Virgisporangium ochraceum]|uniref:Sugar ABC transporter substrate-binding protein n=1 Tax=Virgisporangium ochraceum TaxID=65505 RepID=A0A8J4A0R5_9ACTN|nr:extracellular solute-binding protein [Virgisporangium ochraceum]GIJ72457.1 sugar ABC transporter substrate-binding protein [Virgisporangium ochraceum]
MRRIAAAGLAALLVGTLAACGGDDDGGGSGGSVTLWMYPVIADQAKSQEFWAKVEQDFEAANKGIDAKIELQPWEGRQEKVTTALAAGKGFDLVVLGPDQIPQYVEQGTLEPVDSALDGAKNTFVETSRNALSVDGKLYGVPIYNTSTLPVYNKALLDKAGITDVPDTWDEIRAAAPKLAAQGAATLNYVGAPEETLNLTFYPWLWQNEGQVFAKDGRSVAFNQPAGVEALQFLLDVQKAGGLPAGAATQKSTLDGSPVVTGKAAIMPVAQLSQLAPIRTALGADKVVVGQPIQGRKRVSFGLPGGVVMSKRSENTAAARKLLAYLATPDVIGGLAKASGFMPTRTDVQVAGDDPAARQFAEALPLLYAGDTHPKARQVMSVLAPQIQAALQGRKTAKQALDDAAKEANALLGNS